MHLRTLSGLAALPLLAARRVLGLALALSRALALALARGLHASLRNALYYSRCAWQLNANDLQ